LYALPESKEAIAYENAMASFLHLIKAKSYSQTPHQSKALFFYMCTKKAFVDELSVGSILID
jgi:hypothetical protein